MLVHAAPSGHIHTHAALLEEDADSPLELERDAALLLDLVDDAPVVVAVELVEAALAELEDVPFTVLELDAASPSSTDPPPSTSRE